MKEQKQPEKSKQPESSEQSENPETPKRLEKSKPQEEPEQQDGKNYDAQGGNCVELETSAPSILPPAMNPDESLFFDLTSMANSLRNNTKSFAFPIASEQGMETRSRSSSTVQNAPSIPYSPTSTRSTPILNESPSHGGEKGSWSSLRVIGGSPRPLMAHDTSNVSPPTKYHTWKGHRYELSGDTIPDAHNGLAELSAEPVSSSRS